MLKKVAQLATDTLAQSRQAMEQLLRTAPTQLKEKFLAQIGVAKELLEQTKSKLAGQRSIPERIVSFFDPHARAIVKGKLDKPVEFGRTLELVQDDSGVIVHDEVHHGNPSDKIHLLSLVRTNQKDSHQSPQAIAADRGFYSADNLAKLRRPYGVPIGIPKIGRLTPQRNANINAPSGLEQLQRFRCGIEASISMLKRQFGLGKVLAKGSPATAIWTGWAIFSYNLWQRLDMRLHRRST